MELSKKYNNNLIRMCMDIIFIVGLIYIIPYQSNAYAQFGMVLIFAVAACKLLINHIIQLHPLKPLFTFQIILIIYFYLQIRFGYSANELVSSDRLTEMIVNLILAYVLYYYLKDKSLERIFGILFIALAFLGIRQIVITGGNLREEITQLNVNTLGVLAGYCGAMALCFYILNRKSIYLIALGFLTIIVLLTASRQALLALGVPCMVVLIFQKNRNKLLRAVIVVLGIIIFVSVLMEVPALYDLVGVRIEAAWNSLIGVGTTEISMENREEHYARAMILIAQKPVWGHGLATYSTLAGSTVYSHSNYMELLVSGGIVAFFIYYIPLLSLFFKGIRIKEKQTVDYLAIGIIGTQIFIEYFLVAYYRHFTFLVYILVMVLLEKNNRSDSMNVEQLR